MIEFDIAEIYHLETRVLNQAVKRNANRFPELFRFQLTSIVKFRHGGRIASTIAYTRQGIAILSAWLRSEIALNLGASSKDRGSECFVFSRMDELLPQPKNKLLRF